MIELKNGALNLGVDPSLGASISHFRWNDTPILRETPEAAVQARDGRAYSAFPLIPFSNRIRAARFSFGGQHYLIARDAEDPRHALHGTARFYPWVIAAQSETHLHCVLDYSAQNLDWPFAYQAWQEFTLHGDRLCVSMGIRNLHDAPAPAGLGLHPYFVRVPETTLRFDAGYVWAKDDADIPTHSVPDEGRFNFANRHVIEGGLIDNDYGEWGGAVEIEAQDRPLLSLKASGAFRQLVLFTPIGKPYFAAEPVTHRPDAINPNNDKHDHGMNVLAPGEALEGRIEIIVKG